MSSALYLAIYHLSNKKLGENFVDDRYTIHSLMLLSCHAYLSIICYLVKFIAKTIIHFGKSFKGSMVFFSFFPYCITPTFKSGGFSSRAFISILLMERKSIWSHSFNNILILTVVNLTIRTLNLTQKYHFILTACLIGMSTY